MAAAPGAPSFVIERLAWDSDFFGLPVARLTAPALTGPSLAEAAAALRTADVALAYVMTEQAVAAEEADAVGLVHRDAKTTFRRAVGEGLPAVPGVVIREALAESAAEVAALRALAVESGRVSRFAREERLPREKVAELYERWMDNPLSGSMGARVLVAEGDGGVAGMVTVGERNGAADIGLIAAAPAARGRGVGRALVGAALAWGREAGLAEATVVTQGHNREACALYERCGYHAAEVVQVYHLWL